MRARCLFIIATAGVRLVLSVQPTAALPGFTLQARLTAADAAAGDAFGGRVGLSSDATIALVGAPGVDCAAGSDCGAAYVFVRSESGWSEQAKLTVSDAAANARLGHDVALSGDGATALLRAQSTDCIDSPTCAVVYVFRRIGGSWTETAKLKTIGPFHDDFIRSIAVSGDGQTALLGAPNHCFDIGIPVFPCGTVHVYVRSGESWSEETRLGVDDEVFRFGKSVDLTKDGLTALVGVESGPAELTAGDLRAVGAYTFVRSGGVWVRQHRFAVSSRDLITGPAVPFGEVTLSGDGSTALLSSPSAGCGHQLESGFGFCGGLTVFVRADGGWVDKQFLGIVQTSGFGQRSALSGDGTVVMTTMPAAAVFERTGDVWVEEQRALFGHSMSLSEDGRTALTGVGILPCSAGTNCGAAFIYAAAPAIGEIPTVSGLGLVMLAVLLAGSGAGILFRRRLTPARSPSRSPARRRCRG